MRRTDIIIVFAALFGLGALHSDGYAQKSSRSQKESLRPAPAPKEPEKPTFFVKSDFCPTKDKARENAIVKAIDELRIHLKGLQFPINSEPTLDIIRTMVHPDVEYKEQLVSESKDGTSGEKFYQATIGIIVKQENIRTMRSRERSADILGFLGIGMVGFLCIAAFFRLDVWTKGYMTQWLVFGAAAAGGAAILVWTSAWKW